MLTIQTPMLVVNSDPDLASQECGDHASYASGSLSVLKPEKELGCIPLFFVENELLFLYDPFSDKAMIL